MNELNEPKEQPVDANKLLIDIQSYKNYHGINEKMDRITHRKDGRRKGKRNRRNKK